MRYLTNFYMSYDILFKDFHIGTNTSSSYINDILLKDNNIIFKLETGRDALNLEYSRLHKLLSAIDPSNQILEKIIGVSELLPLYATDSFVGRHKQDSGTTIYVPVVDMKRIDFSLSIIPDTNDITELTQRISQLIEVIEEIELVLGILNIRREAIIGAD